MESNSIPRNPGLRLSAKAVYRLRQKLQSALLRLVEVLGKMEAAGVEVNIDNMATGDMVLTYLRSRVLSGLGDWKVELNPVGLDALKQAKKRRHKETAALSNRLKGVVPTECRPMVDIP